MTELTEEEKRKIYEEEKARLEAQEKLKKAAAAKKNKNAGMGCLVLIGLIVILALLGVFNSGTNESQSGSVSSSNNVEPPTAQDEQMMNSLIAAKFIEKIDPSLNEALVNPLIWATTKYEDKEKIAWFLAQYCGKKKGTGTYWVEIKDSYSGKLVAKYGAWGFKVY